MENLTVNIRSSMLPSYSDCPRRAAAKAFSHLITPAGFQLRQLPPSIGASIGTGCHKGSIKLVDDIINNGIPGDLNDAIDMSIIDFRERISEGAVWDSITVNQNEAEHQIRILVGSFLREVAPKLKPTHTERPHRANIDTGFQLTGHTDIESTDNSIDDLKYGARMRPYFQQLGGYSLLKKTVDKTQPPVLRLYHLPRVSLKKSYPGASVHEYDVAECEQSAWWTLKHIISHVKKFQATGEPWCFPANPMSMMCSDKYCPAWGTEFCKMGCKK